MGVLYKSVLKKFVKKQTRAFQLAIEDETEKINKNPDIGEIKKGDLSGFMVHKFKFQKQEYLIAYKLQNNDMVFYPALQKAPSVKTGMNENVFPEGFFPKATPVKAWCGVYMIGTHENFYRELKQYIREVK
jgi:hypothetical protein